MAPEEAYILRRFRTALARAYGDNLARVVLFGSRARGDARPDSHYDVAVFLKTSRGFGWESETLADTLIEYGAVINALPFETAALAHETAFMETVRREGLTVFS